MRILLGVAWGACSLGHARPAGAAAPTTITWKGIQWNVKSGTGINPGFNSWSPANAFVDANGDLHLMITKVNGTWYCSEIWTDAAFPLGTFQWQLQSPVDNLDPNVVLGLFVYGPPALGPDGTHEIDVEYGRFGSPTADLGRWTIWPNQLTSPLVPARSSYPLVLGGDGTTTSRFSWASTSVAFETLGGLQPVGSEANLIHSWSYQPSDPSTTISQSPMPVHMNLWLYRGSPPTDGRDVEVIIHDFSFVPSSVAVASPVPAVTGHGALILVVALAGVGSFLLRRRRAGLSPRRGL